MDIRIFVGAHRTASKHMAAVLSENIELLEAQDTIFYVNSNNALRHINTAIKAIAEGSDNTDVTGQMLHSLTRGRDVKRLLMINPNFVGSVAQPFGKELFYPRTTALIHQLQTLFDGNVMQLFAATRNPASYLPSCYAQSLMSASFSTYKEFLSELDMQNIKWSPFLYRLLGKQANIPLTVWRFEDYPYIWRDILQAFSGISNSQDLAGNSNRINPGLTLQGAQLLNGYIADNPPRTREGFENTTQVFLKKFPSSADEIAGPDWSGEMVKTLTNNYEDDWYYIERMDGVKTIVPRDFG
jgi:hypothetical protein